MEHFSDQVEIGSLIPLANLLGIIYQIRDDYQNLKNDELQMNKGFCEDISEGKFSFPIVHSLNKNSTDQTLLGILKQRTDNDDIKKFALSYLEKTDSFGYTERSLVFLRGKAVKLIGEIIKNVGKNREEFEDIEKLVIKLTEI